MMKASIKCIRVAASLIVLGLLGPLVTGCGGNSTQALSGPPVYVLSITSVAGPHETISAISPADLEGVTSGTTGLQLYYKPGTTVTVTANAKDTNGTGGPFLGWCDASSTFSSPFTCNAPPCTSMSGLTCTLTLNSNVNLLATYPGVTGITITPVNATDSFPAQVQFNVLVDGLGTYMVTPMSPALPYQGSPYTFTLTATTPQNYGGLVGTISSTGLYTPPFPAPTSVTVRATSALVPVDSASALLTIDIPTMATGPALTVDVGSPTHPISPDIYGINDYGLDASIPAAINLPIERWGGDATTRYNYLVDADNSAGDYYFETSFNNQNTTYPLTSQFNSQVTQDRLTNTKTLATVPLIGYTTQRIAGACSYSVKKYGAQTMVDQYNMDCGTGILSNGNTPIKNDPTDTSVAIDQSFDSGWVQFLIGQFGTAANGGVALYGLDNEPEYWSAVHKDVHPVPFTYDELSTKGINYAAAIKAQDPSALVTGPVISNWTDYFYSATDIADGYASSPSCPQANPQDRIAHGDVPLMDYYLQQFQNYDTANGVRLLDYVDLHTYFAAPGAAFALAGDIPLQQARLNSTRVFWDPTYTDPNYTDPTDTPTTRACNGLPYAPNLINLEKTWVANDYPGTKLGITEYNWGGQEAINGALAQADILGIFGREGLDLGVLWGPPKPTQSGGITVQMPGIIAFQAYTNYDGKNSHFGETAVTSTSVDQGTLAVYGATRASDGALTAVVINKGYVDLTSTLTLPNLTPNGSALSYIYSATNLSSIVAQPSVTVTAPAAGSTSSSLTTLFPAQSITVLVIPKM